MPGRFRALLSGLYRYIELNPVRAWMVGHPVGYPWSSFAATSGERGVPLLTPHLGYLALGADSVARAFAYRELFAEAMPDELVNEKALGTDRFRAWVEARTGRFAGLRPVGRQPIR